MFKKDNTNYKEKTEKHYSRKIEKMNYKEGTEEKKWGSVYCDQFNVSKASRAPTKLMVAHQEHLARPVLVVLVVVVVVAVVLVLVVLK